MLMPRFAASYKLNDKTVLKAGAGLYYDTLNATNASVTQTGYSVTTTTTASTDFGQTWAFGDLKTNPLAAIGNPFPIRADGTRFDSPIGSQLGYDSLYGTNYTFENRDRQHPQVTRYRLGVQRELNRVTSVELAFTGTYGNDLSFGQPLVYVPEQYYNSSNVRDLTQQNLLQSNVTNPFFIDNFASMKATDPQLYQRMSTSSFFTAKTVQRQALLRGFPAYTGLTSSNQPQDINKAYDLGANSYLVKPHNNSQLSELANRVQRYWLEMNECPASLAA